MGEELSSQNWRAGQDHGDGVFIETGQHVGKKGVLENIQTRTAKVKAGNEMLETDKDYVIVIGKEKPEIEI